MERFWHSTCFEVMQVTEARGPAAVVRIAEHPEMEETVGWLVDRYRLSGFCGFDFILTETGEPKLLEVNPRVIPTAHLLVDGCLDSGRVFTLSSSNAKPIEKAAGELERIGADA